MSGTSLDGIDAALIETDGAARVRAVAVLGIAYDDGTRSLLAGATQAALALPRAGPEALVDEAARRSTELHAEVVAILLAQAKVTANEVAVIGYHGQTVAHRPADRWTWQIGDGARLAALTGIDVVDDFRSADVAAGGQGAPLLPVYHAALLAAEAKPAALLNLGGIANLTLIDADGALVAFDTGPANALLDDWAAAETGARFDADGALAAAGRVDESVLTAMLDHPWFDLPPPKSLDRSDFTIAPVRGLGAADGAATLARFTAETVALGLRHGARPARLVVAGGGRRNPVLMRMLAEAGALPVVPIETLGRDGDATEAEGFAYMAVRHLRGLPISFPGTTGVPAPMKGGRLHRAGAAA